MCVLILATNLSEIFLITEKNSARYYHKCTLVKGKAVPLQAWSDPEGSRKLRLPDFVTTAREDWWLSALRTGRLYPPGNAPGTHFC